MNQRIYPDHSSIGGLPANLIALLAYLGPILLNFVPGLRYVSWALPIVFYFLETESEFVRFHSMQSILLHVLSLVINLVFAFFGVGLFATLFFVPVGAAIGFGILGLLAIIVPIALLVIEIIAMVRAYRYEIYYIPIIGGIAAGIVGNR